MKKEQMVGARLSSKLVRELELIGDVEQSDRSTTVRRLLSQAIQQWKLEHYVRLYGDGKLTLARATRDAGVSLWETMDYAPPERCLPTTTLRTLSETSEPSTEAWVCQGWSKREPLERSKDRPSRGEDSFRIVDAAYLR